MLSLIGRMVKGNRTPAARPARPRQEIHFRPSLLRLEEREVLSSPGSIALPPLPAFVPALVAPAAHIAGSVTQQVTQIVPLSITGLSLNTVTNQLTATGLLGGQAFSAPVTLTATPAAATPGSTPVLHLALGPIDLNLLGLEVKTSKICLDITAESGPGKLLGNLVTDVANLLNGGSPLSGLTSTQLTGLSTILNSGVQAATAPSAVTGASTNVLNLSLGPVDLNLLGLNVHLDNCDNGPITVDVIAHSGPGNLLGNLVGGLAHLLDGNTSLAALTHRLELIATQILRHL